MTLVQFSGLRDNTIRLYFDVTVDTTGAEGFIDGLVVAIVIEADEGIPGRITATSTLFAQPFVINTTDTGTVRKPRFNIPGNRRFRYQDGPPGELTLNFDPRAV